MKKLLFIFSLLFFTDSFAADLSKTLTNRSKSIGTYNAGCITGTEALTDNGYGYQVMNMARQRYYANPVLVNYIKQFSREVKDKLKGQLLIGDMGNIHGGPLNSGHVSHQTGLDVDIWFWHPKDNKALNKWEQKKAIAVSLLSNYEKMIIDKKFWNYYSPDYFPNLLKLAASKQNVDRIFVNPGIKKKLCTQYKGQGWLHKIRPWWAHHDHFHVRLKCPLDNDTCKSQDPIPDVGDGCNADLDYWFSPQAKIDLMKAQKAPKKEIILPEECKKLLKK